jgi:hypothetical protein
MIQLFRHLAAPTDVDGDGVIDRMPLFDSRLQDYFWQYDNQGLQLVPLRFYELPTDVN